MEEIQNLLSAIQEVVERERKIREKKGEDFNIFLITKKASNEQYTHSAFIAELLNPKGLHHKGDIFLKKFINQIFESIPFENRSNRVNTIFNYYNSCESLKSTEVRKELNIGKLILSAKEKCQATGGVIDILLNLNGYTISIENKIYANLQPRQIERYINYNKKKNIVFYLTLNGSKPENEKCTKLESDYYCISYYKEIDEWLKNCLSVDGLQPILKESIRQYQILIQKLSSKMNNSKDLQKLILDNIEASDSLYNNYNGALNKIKEDFRNSIINSLNNAIKIEFKEEFDVAEKFNSIENKNARIYIKHKKYYDRAKVYFGIESFSGNTNGKIYGGIYVFEGDKNKKLVNFINKNSTNYWWPLKECIFENSLRDTSTLINLHTNKEYREKAIFGIIEKMIKFIEKHKESVLKANKYFIK